MNRKGSMTIDTAIILPIVIVLLILLLGIMVKAWQDCDVLNIRFKENTLKWSESKPGRLWGGIDEKIK